MRAILMTMTFIVIGLLGTFKFILDYLPFKEKPFSILNEVAISLIVFFMLLGMARIVGVLFNWLKRGQ